MNDPLAGVDARLRADADRDAAIPPPSFAAAVGNATSARFRPAVLISAAAAVVVVAGGVSIFVASHDSASKHSPGIGSSNQSSGPASPAPGDEFRPIEDVGFRGAILDPADATTILVVVPTGAQNGFCSSTDQTGHVVHEDASSVTIRVSGIEEWSSIVSAAGNADTGCDDESYGVQVPVQLAAPLGGRKLIDSATGKSQYVLDPASVPTPLYLPGPFGEPEVDLTIWHGQPLADRHYRKTSQDGTVIDLTITTGPASSMAATGAAHVESVPIGTYTGSYTTDPQCISWAQSPSRSVQVCAIVQTNSESTLPPPFSKATMLRIARSLL